MRSRPAAVLLTVLLATGVTGVAGPAQARAGGAERTYAATAHGATNVARTRQGLGKLERSTCLDRYARRQARRIAAAGELSHQDLGAVLQGCGLSAAAENVAVGYSTGKSVVREGWMHSEGHRTNILGERYRAEGIGAVKVGGRWWVAQVFGG